MYLKSISDFGPGQEDRGWAGSRGPQWLISPWWGFSRRASSHTSPEPLCFFLPALVRNLERALKERKPSLPSPLAESSIIRPSLPNHETQVERDLQQCFSPGPGWPLIVPETTDGNCERKHVNIAGVMAESSVEQRSSPSSQGSYYAMKRSKAFRKTTTLCQKW